MKHYKTFQKWEQILFLLSLLERHPEGMTEAQISKIMNTHRRNINNYLRELREKGYILSEGTKHRDLIYKVRPGREHNESG